MKISKHIIFAAFFLALFIVKPFYSQNYGDKKYYLIDSLNLDELSDSYLKIYPNPTKGKLFIETDAYVIRRIQVIDQFGKVVKDMQANNFKSILNISEQSNGIYIIKTYTDTGISINKLILQK